MTKLNDDFGLIPKSSDKSPHYFIIYNLINIFNLVTDFIDFLTVCFIAPLLKITNLLFHRFYPSIVCNFFSHQPPYTFNGNCTGCSRNAFLSASTEPSMLKLFDTDQPIILREYISVNSDK